MTEKRPIQINQIRTAKKLSQPGLEAAPVLNIDTTIEIQFPGEKARMYKIAPNSDEEKGTMHQRTLIALAIAESKEKGELGEVSPEKAKIIKYGDVTNRKQITLLSITFPHSNSHS